MALLAPRESASLRRLTGTELVCCLGGSTFDPDGGSDGRMGFLGQDRVTGNEGDGANALPLRRLELGSLTQSHEPQKKSSDPLRAEPGQEQAQGAGAQARAGQVFLQK
jgi:hypothetical protein